MATHANADRIRTNALERLTALVSKHCPSAPSTFAQELEVAIVTAHPAPPAYRERLLALLSNLPKVGNDAVALGPLKLATLPASEITSFIAAQKKEQEQRERAKENLMRGGDGLSTACPRCQRAVRSKLNTNRFDVEDELLGQQYQNNYDEFCVCRRRWRDEEKEEEAAERRQSRREKSRKRRDGEAVSGSSSAASSMIRTDDSDWTLASASSASDDE